MFVNGEDVAVMLCREGLAKTDEYSATKELTDAENEAKQAKKNVCRLIPPPSSPSPLASTAAAPPFRSTVLTSYR